MIKLKLLLEKKGKKNKKDKEPVYPEIVMLPDVVMEKDKFIEFMKKTYNIEIKEKVK